MAADRWAQAVACPAGVVVCQAAAVACLAAAEVHPAAAVATPAVELEEQLTKTYLLRSTRL